MRGLQNAAGLLFIACLLVLTVVAILGVWSVFSHDVIMKSFETLGVIALAAAVTIIAGRFLDSSPVVSSDSMIPTFKAIRYLTLTTLIASAALLALVGILAIWDVIQSGDVLQKSLSSIAIVTFSSYLAVAVCLERESHPLWQKLSSELSAGIFIALFVLGWIAFFTQLI